MDDAITLIIRTANAVLWSFVVARILYEDVPVSRLTRRLLATVLFFGMWVLALSGLANIRVIPAELSSFMITVFTAYAAIMALAIVRK